MNFLKFTLVSSHILMTSVLLHIFNKALPPGITQLKVENLKMLILWLAITRSVNRKNLMSCSESKTQLIHLSTIHRFPYLFLSILYLIPLPLFMLNIFSISLTHNLNWKLQFPFLVKSPFASLGGLHYLFHIPSRLITIHNHLVSLYQVCILCVWDSVVHSSWRK